jgi:protein-L-isoaspartate(D-aspartate) O-methyltransferase
MPVEEGYMQHIYVIDKKEDGTVTKTRDMGVQYVPLTDAPKE